MRESIRAVIHTLLEAVVLVVLVVILFLQTWRASIIPLLAVPVSIVGTFSLMLLLGFSINTLTLFGLVLAIGVVVDDAIVVVENVERNIEAGLSAREATYQAMREVSGPIIAIGLTLIAVFVPIAFISGLTGQFYRQFALTIALSTVISAFNSLTLSPAIAALLLKGHSTLPDALSRWMDRRLAWLFDPFNRAFIRAGERYSIGVSRVLHAKAPAIALYLLLIGGAAFLFVNVPTGYIPKQDRQYLMGFVELPAGASLDRTEAVVRQMGEIALSIPGIDHAVQFAGLSLHGFSNSSNAGMVFLRLSDFSERPGLSAEAIAQQANQQFSAIHGARVMVLSPPPVRGLGTTGGFKLQVQDRANLGDDALSDAVNAVLENARKHPVLNPNGTFSGFEINVPQLSVDIDRDRAQQLGVPIPAIFSTMQIYLGSLYVNDFNQFGRTYRVVAQADAPFRARAEDITRLKVRSASGEMIPLGSVLSVKQSYGPQRAYRYNNFRSADINSGPAPGYSSGEAESAMTDVLKATLPAGMTFDWTELTYQKMLVGNTAIYVFPLCVLFVFLVLAAQYESLVLPLAVILIVPMCVFCAILGVKLSGGDNNIFTQVGFVVLVGLACKNAILIVEFARELEIEGRSTVEAAIEAARLRLRPILMTSFAFIMGVVPLVLATGAGAEMRHAMGIAVFSGMLGVTFFGLFLTPVFYVGLRLLFGGTLHSASGPALGVREDHHE